MTELDLFGLGFECKKQYNHDQFNTNRYVKGVLQVEFTYEAETLISTELTIEEINSKPISFEEMKALTPILGKWTE